MNPIDMTNPLANGPRALREPTQAAHSRFDAADSQGENDFASVLKAMLAHVNQSQRHATTLAESFDMGQEQDLAGVMIAQQKARLNFQATLQVRNKIVSAYQDIMNMPI